MTNPDRILVAQDAHLYLAPVGSTMPTNATSAPSAADTDWLEVGLFTDDSLQWATEPEFEDITSHQAFYPTRNVQTGDAATLSVELQEWSGTNLVAVYGGGSITEPSAGVYKFTPPTPGARAETAALLDIRDGTKHYRLCLPRTSQREGVEIPLQKGEEAVLALSLSILDPGSGQDAWWIISDDPAMEP